MDKKLLYRFLGRHAQHEASLPGKDQDENRKVAFVPDGENSWRVVWADEVVKK
jgi:hypothetical protein